MTSDLNHLYESIIYRMNDGMVLEITVGELKAIIDSENHRCYACHKKMLSKEYGFCSVQCNIDFHNGFWNCEGVRK